MHSTKKPQKRLIVNADDFGLDPAINHGIIEAFKNGIVTNTSLVVCGKAHDEAIELARKHRLGVGIHLALNEESPILRRDKIETLIGKDGRFFGLSNFLRRFFLRTIDLKHIYSEFEAQIERFTKSGIEPTHLDSHNHVHILPEIFDITLKLARRFGIPRIRLSRNSMATLLKTRRYRRGVAVMGLSTLANIQSRKIGQYKVRTPDRCCGLIESGRLDESRLKDILNSLLVGTSELICHPGIGTAGLSKKYRWGYFWGDELKALTSQNTRSLIDRLGIELIQYDAI
ncbi:MAG: ChbG/HpnK family deacetylase [Candidatus Omnitrophica bacterium]|nr:ChbG/HpnK family deacetylase [Candidatus Omnitrophota bacterium]